MNSALVLTRTGKCGSDKPCRSTGRSLYLALVETPTTEEQTSIAELLEEMGFRWEATVSAVWDKVDVVYKEGDVECQPWQNYIKPEWFVHPYSGSSYGVLPERVSIVPLPLLRSLVSYWGPRASIAVQEVRNYVQEQAAAS